MFYRLSFRHNKNHLILKVVTQRKFAWKTYLIIIRLYLWQNKFWLRHFPSYLLDEMRVLMQINLPHNETFFRMNASIAFYFKC